MNYKNTYTRTLLRKIFILAMLALACPICALAEKAPQLKVLQSGPYRVLYYTEGALAVDPTDLNGNGIPDRVEDMLTSVAASRLLFCKLLGYPDPLNSQLLPKARFIDIRVESSGANTPSGVSFPKDIPNNPPGAGSLVIHVSPKADNRPPFAIPHEFFHLIQHAATYCAKKWFTEGTAVWQTQGVLSAGTEKKLDGTVPFDHWPLTPQEASRIFEMSYGASEFFWNRLALLCDNDGEIPRGPVFEQLKAMKYSDGSPVLKGTKLVGWRLMRDVLLQIGKVASAGSGKHDDAEILHAVEKAVAGYLPKQMPAKTVPAGADIATEKVETKIHQVGDIRVIYQTSGMDAVKPDDLNNNGIPDQVEDALTQVAAARTLLVELLGLPDPLRARNFSGARYVDIRFVSNKDVFYRLKERTPVAFPKDIPGASSRDGSLLIKSRQGTNPRASCTLAQDYFYLVAQASTRVNSWWCLGGLAASSSFGLFSFHPRWVPLEKWPLPQDMTQKLFRMRTDSARYLWGPLVARYDPDGELPRGPVFEKLSAMKYTDGTPVLKSTNIPGWRLMRDVLAELGKLDNNSNDAAILRAIEKAVAKQQKGPK